MSTCTYFCTNAILILNWVLPQSTYPDSSHPASCTKYFVHRIKKGLLDSQSPLESRVHSALGGAAIGRADNSESPICGGWGTEAEHLVCVYLDFIRVFSSGIWTGNFTSVCLYICSGQFLKYNRSFPDSPLPLDRYRSDAIWSRQMRRLDRWRRHQQMEDDHNRRDVTSHRGRMPRLRAVNVKPVSKRFILSIPV